AAAALLLGLLPGLAAVLLLRRSLRDLGLGAGEWRLGLGIAVPTAAVVLAATFLARGDPAGLCGLYPLSSLAAAGGVGLLAWEAAYLVYYIAWEGLFRGVVQLGLGERWGFAPAAALQTALSALLHAGHPEAETLAACLAGPLLGWLAWRVRSIWPGVLIHAGHPEAETLAACLAGPLLGWLAWRVRSIWPGVLIHAAAGLATDLSCGILAS
ncbi:MAG: CPBP family intramembrane metalloprotease, partial [Deltaproteobacteria bacterium]|nr:CPBP family intramembrane metalloprotease [Deltaproteobacteria bacterium]